MLLDRVTDGATDQTTAVVVIGDATGMNLPPMADANGPYTGVAGGPVTFDGTASDDPDGNIVHYDWAFGDGPIGLDAGPTPDYSYPAGGLYNVILRVTDDGGLVDSDNALSFIGGLSLPPTGDAGGPYAGRLGVAVSFDGTACNDPDGYIEQYDWDFGDDSIGTGPTPSHIYAAAGKYIVKLTFTDNSGETDTVATVAAVRIGNLPPQADAGDKVSGEVRRRIRFDGTGSSDPDGIIKRYKWDFGDGKIGAGRTPTHVYKKPGTYFVALTVTDSDGATNSDATLAVISSRFECKKECREDKDECLDAARVDRETCVGSCDQERDDALSVCKRLPVWRAWWCRIKAYLADRQRKRACRSDYRDALEKCRAEFRACRAECR